MHCHGCLQRAVHTYFAACACAPSTGLELCALALLIHPWRVLVEMQSCPVLCAGCEFMLSCSRTNLCAAAASSSVLLGGRFCVVALLLLWHFAGLCPVSGVLQQLCSTSASQLLVQHDRRSAATGAECASAFSHSLWCAHQKWHFWTVYPPVRFPASSLLQGVAMHPSIELHCFSAWRLLLQRILTDCMMSWHAVDSRLWCWAPVSMHQLWVMSSTSPASLPSG
jgi:hypothetical protein